MFILDTNQLYVDFAESVRKNNNDDNVARHIGLYDVAENDGIVEKSSIATHSMQDVRSLRVQVAEPIYTFSISARHIPKDLDEPFDVNFMGTNPKFQYAKMTTQLTRRGIRGDIKLQNALVFDMKVDEGTNFDSMSVNTIYIAIVAFNTCLEAAEKHVFN